MIAEYMDIITQVNNSERGVKMDSLWRQARSEEEEKDKG